MLESHLKLVLYYIVPRASTIPSSILLALRAREYLNNIVKSAAIKKRKIEWKNNNCSYNCFISSLHRMKKHALYIKKGMYFGNYIIQEWTQSSKCNCKDIDILPPLDRKAFKRLLEKVIKRNSEAYYV